MKQDQARAVWHRRRRKKEGEAKRLYCTPGWGGRTSGGGEGQQGSTSITHSVPASAAPRHAKPKMWLRLLLLRCHHCGRCKPGGRAVAAATKPAGAGTYTKAAAAASQCHLCLQGLQLQLLWRLCRLRLHGRQRRGVQRARHTVQTRRQAGQGRSGKQQQAHVRRGCVAAHLTAELPTFCGRVVGAEGMAGSASSPILCPGAGPASMSVSSSCAASISCNIGAHNQGRDRRTCRTVGAAKGHKSMHALNAADVGRSVWRHEAP